MQSNQVLRPLQRFWLLLKPDQKEIKNVYVYAFFNGLVNLSLPVGIQAIINLIQGGQMNTSWIVLVCFVILGVAITGILQICQLRITENLKQNIFVRAAFEFAHRIPRIKLSALYKHYAPELMNRFFDVMSLQKGLAKILIDFSTASIQVIFGLILLSIYHPFFILFSFVLIGLVLAIIKYTAKIGLETSLAESKHKYNVAHWLEELARTNVTFKLAGKTDLPLDKTNDHVTKYLDAREGHFKILVKQYSLMVVFKVLVATGLLAIGGKLVMDQQMNIGQFVAAEIIILLVMASVEKLILSFEVIYDVLTSLEKIGQVTDLPLEKRGEIDLRHVCKDKGLSVTLKDVNFTYPDHNQKILKNVSLNIEKGENILVVGDNYSGKTTLFYLIAGLYEPQDGFINYDGFAQGNIDSQALRSVIGDCLTDELLFEGTVLDNITMGRDSATFDNVLWATRNLGLEEFIRQLPEGFETMINPEGKQFSRGLINKLLLARSIADKPKMLMIKDLFSAFSKKERKRIIEFLTSDKNGWTMIISSTDDALAEQMDRTVTIEKGKII